MYKNAPLYSVQALKPKSKACYSPRGTRLARRKISRPWTDVKDFLGRQEDARSRNKIANKWMYTVVQKFGITARSTESSRLKELSSRKFYPRSSKLSVLENFANGGFVN